MPALPSGAVAAARRGPAAEAQPLDFRVKQAPCNWLDRRCRSLKGHLFRIPLTSLLSGFPPSQAWKVVPFGCASVNTSYTRGLIPNLHPLLPLFVFFWASNWAAVG